MNKSTKHLSLIALVFLCAIACIFSACKETDPWLAELPLDPETASPNGSIVSAMDGSVMLFVPAGAVLEPVKLVVNECFDEFSYNFLMRMVKIEPLIYFQKPVSLKLRYDGQLANGESPCEGMKLTAYYWDRMENFINREPGKMLCCSLDTAHNTISMCITQTGIYAVRTIGNGGEYN